MRQRLLTDSNTQVNTQNPGANDNDSTTRHKTMDELLCFSVAQLRVKTSDKYVSKCERVLAESPPQWGKLKCDKQHEQSRSLILPFRRSHMLVHIVHIGRSNGDWDGLGFRTTTLERLDELLDLLSYFAQIFVSLTSHFTQITFEKMQFPFAT